MMPTFLTAFILFFTLSTLSAPMPATSSSDFLKTGIGLFRSPSGFQISSEKTQWLHVEAPKDQKFISTIYKAPESYKGVQPLISVRLDTLDKRRTLNQYMREWLKVYPRLGFQVLGSKKVIVKRRRGFMMDLIHSKTQRQIRQVVFIKDKNAIVMTCRGHQENFQITVKSCNQIIRNFAWINKASS